METTSRLLLNYIVNAAWMAVVVACVAWLCARFIQRMPARRLCVLWIASLALSVLLPMVSVLRVPRDAEIATQANSGTTLTEQSALLTRKAPSLFWTSGTSHRQVSLAPFLTTALLGLYCTFLMYGTARVWLSWKRTKSICNAANAIVLPVEFAVAAEECFRAFGIRPSTIAVSNRVSGPATAGVRHTVLILPEGFLLAASVKDFTSALKHELAHIRRRDFLWNIVCEWLLVPICFHPAAAFIKRRIAGSREMACDELAAEHSQTRAAYARSLLNLAKRMVGGAEETVSSHYALGLFDIDTLEERIVTLLQRKSISPATERLLAIIAGALLMTACAFTSAFPLQIASAKASDDIRAFVGTWEARFDGKTFQTIKIENKDGKLTGTANHIAIALDPDGNLIGAKAKDGSDQITSAKVEGKLLHLTCTGKAHLDTDRGASDTETTQYEMKLTGADEAEIHPVGEGVDAPSLKPWKLARVKK